MIDYEALCLVISEGAFMFCVLAILTLIYFKDTK
ncbi:hypothetical protein SEPB62_19031 [Salmonella enterica subsp. enterica serovar Paratyphi B str. SARA62]|nr:hypothetical protein SEPB62_19031 [Salmonella enterica subsp. enterica serovar Paratyphi B str. SARA62]ESF86664.1 hypothetical protein SEEPB585_04181 [Salmonella enterica subsp. enterica serovar Paratyphi B str. ATCC BAA-1585]